MKTFKQYLKENNEHSGEITESRENGWYIIFDSVGEKYKGFGYPNVEGDVVYLDDTKYKYTKDDNVDHWDNIQKIHYKLYKLTQKFDKEVIDLMKKYGYEYRGK